MYSDYSQVTRTVQILEEWEDGDFYGGTVDGKGVNRPMTFYVHFPVKWNSFRT